MVIWIFSLLRFLETKTLGPVQKISKKSSVLGDTIVRNQSWALSSDWLLIKWTPLKVATLAYHPSVTLIIRDQAPVFEKKGDPQIQSINRNAPNLPSPSLGHIVSERRNLWWACQSSPNAGQAKFQWSRVKYLLWSGSSSQWLYCILYMSRRHFERRNQEVNCLLIIFSVNFITPCTQMGASPRKMSAWNTFHWHTLRTNASMSTTNRGKTASMVWSSPILLLWGLEATGRDSMLFLCPGRTRERYQQTQRSTDKQPDPCTSRGQQAQHSCPQFWTSSWARSWTKFRWIWFD